MSYLLGKTKPTAGKISDLLAQFEKERAGNGSIALPFRNLNNMIGGGLRRGFSSVIAGPPGNGKSYFTYRLILWFLDHGVTVKYLPLEYDAVDHIRRTMAVHLNSWGLVQDGEDLAKDREEAFTTHSEMLVKFDEIEACICNNPGEVEIDQHGKPFAPDVPYSEMIEIMAHYAGQNDVFIIDPITAIDEDPRCGPDHKQQENFVRQAKASAKGTGCHIILVSHTRRRQRHNGKHMPLTMDDIAGTVAIPRFVQNLFLLDFHDKKLSTVQRSRAMCEDIEHSRTMYIGKATYGSGTGQRIAFDFDGGPQMREYGWMNDDKEE